MGGRSREPRNNTIDRYAFLAELTDERLNNYGNSTALALYNHDDGGSSTTLTGKPKVPNYLNIAAADEYKRRNGTFPTWHHQDNDRAWRK